MPQDAFTIRLIAKELDHVLRGGKINKINQPAKEELSLLIYTGKRTVKLTLNANASDCGVYFTQDAQENPLAAPNFCMLLRKHLSGAEILGIDTPGFERILILHMKCSSDFSVNERELRAEIMGKYSNLILTENGVILGAMKTTSLDENCKRTIFPGAEYVPPAPQDKVNPSDFEALSRLFPAPPEGDAAQFLFTRVAGLAPCTAKQIADAYRGGSFAQHVYDEIFSDEISPRVKEENGIAADFFARAEEGIPFETISEAQSYFYGKRRKKKALDDARRKAVSVLNAALKKLQKRMAQTLEKLKESGGAETNRVKGELLTANLYRLSRGMKSCVLQNYYDGTQTNILLDETLTPSQNAQNYYKRYRKQKRAQEFLLPQKTELEAEIDYIESLLAAAAAAETEEDFRMLEEELTAAGLIKEQPQKKRRQKEEVPFRSYEYGGFSIYAGRNNLQNDALVRASAPDDVWLHAQKYHSCHVVVKTQGKSVPDSVLLYAAQICARYSDGKGGRIPIDYCLVKYVKKPPKSKAGFVVYTDYRTILCEPLP